MIKLHSSEHKIWRGVPFLYTLQGEGREGGLQCLSYIYMKQYASFLLISYLWFSIICLHCLPVCIKVMKYTVYTEMISSIQQSPKSPGLCLKVCLGLFLCTGGLGQRSIRQPPFHGYGGRQGSESNQDTSRLNETLLGEGDMFGSVAKVMDPPLEVSWEMLLSQDGGSASYAGGCARWRFCSWRFATPAKQCILPKT